MADLLQILKGTGVRPRVTFFANGVASDLDSGVPTVTITKPDGTAIVSGTVTKPAATTGIYEFTLAPQAECTFLTVTWAGPIGGVTETITTYVEVLGNLLFAIPTFRGIEVGTGFPFASNATPLFTDQQIMDARTAVLDEFEEILAFPPVPRFHRVTLDGTGGYALFPTDRVLKDPRLLSISVNGTAQSTSGYRFTAASELQAVSNYSTGTAFPAGLGNVTVEMVHGWTRLTGEGSNWAMARTAQILQPSFGQNAATVTTPEGFSYNYDRAGSINRAGQQVHFGAASLAEWLNRHARPIIGIA